MYRVYVKHRSYKRAQSIGTLFDNLDSAKKSAQIQKRSWWGQNGIYEWVKVKDAETGKYVYIVED